MDPNRKDIAELFGLELPDMTESYEALPRKSRGETADESVELGTQSLNEGNYEKAFEHFRRAIEQRGPNDIRGRIDLAGAYEVADMAPEAFRQYEKALRVQKASEPYVGLSQLYKRNARWQDSIAKLEEAITLDPGNAFYRFKLAEVLREAGDREKALEVAYGAVAAAPEDSFYHYWVGDLLVDLRRFDEALESLRAAIELSPGDDFLYLRAAAAFWGAGKRPEAVKAIRLSSDLDPDKHLYHGILELFLSEMGLEIESDQEAARSSKMDDYDREQLRRFAEEVGLTI